FFQAEDGIRDGHVTGVQTCALPISRNWRTVSGRVNPLTRSSRERASASTSNRCFSSTSSVPGGAAVELSVMSITIGHERGERYEIGRASCRERVKIAVGRAAVKRRE